MGEISERGFQYEHEKVTENLLSSLSEAEMLERNRIMHEYQGRKDSCHIDCQENIKDFNEYFSYRANREKLNYTFPDGLDKIGLKKGRNRQVFLSSEEGYGEKVPGKFIGSGLVYDSETIFTNWHVVASLIPVDKEITKEDLERIHIFFGRDDIKIKDIYIDRKNDAVVIKFSNSETTFDTLDTEIQTTKFNGPLVLFGSTNDLGDGPERNFSLDIFDSSFLKTKITNKILDPGLEGDLTKKTFSVPGFAEPGDSGSGVYNIDGKNNPLIGVVSSLDRGEKETKIIPISVYLDLLDKNES